MGSCLKLRTDSLQARTAASVLFHLLIIAAVSFRWSGWWVKPTPPAGDTHGVRALLFYTPGPPQNFARPAIKAAAVRRPPRKLTALPFPPSPPRTNEAAAVDALPLDAAAGNDALGTGSVSILYIQPFPKQNPDLSRLAGGAQGDIVVGLQIDCSGRVASAIAKKGLGHGVDEMVIATVGRWLFRPASKNGRPVASQQEVRFHYHLTRDPMTSGWEAFSLVER
jgi:protein TonB